MNATQALEALKQGKVVEGSQHVGRFVMIGEEVYFNCGEENCCEWTNTQAEFLGYNEEEFRIVN